LDNPKAAEEIAAFVRFNAPLPANLIAPELADELEVAYWRAFWELSSERQQGGVIGWRAIHDYARIKGMEPLAFSAIIRQMDEAYLNHKTGASKVFSRETMRK
jgi:hypothetical protein